LRSLRSRKSGLAPRSPSTTLRLEWCEASLRR
jgi:hypothetical protein